MRLNLTITTGGDDLRGGGGAGDNCDVILKLRSGRISRTSNVNRNSRWNNNESHTVQLSFPPGTRAGDVIELTLHTQFGGGIGGDNWNVNRVVLEADWE